MARQRGSRQVTAFPRRRKSWEEGPGGSITVSIAGAGNTVFLGSFISPTLDGLTLLRIRGALQFLLTASSVANGGMAGAFGIGLATVAAIIAGAASVPTPLTEQAWDGWLYWMPLQIHTVTATIADGVNAVTAQQAFEVDSRAMRKWKEEDGIYAMVEVGTETGVAVGELRFDSRVLLALP